MTYFYLLVSSYETYLKKTMEQEQSSQVELKVEDVGGGGDDLAGNKLNTTLADSGQQQDVKNTEILQQPPPSQAPQHLLDLDDFMDEEEEDPLSFRGREFYSKSQNNTTTTSCSSSTHHKPQQYSSSTPFKISRLVRTLARVENKDNFISCIDSILTKLSCSGQDRYYIYKSWTLLSTTMADTWKELATGKKE